LLRAVIEAIDRRGERELGSGGFADRYDQAVIAGQFARELKSRVGEAILPAHKPNTDPENA
jgi:hypothetical protein